MNREELYDGITDIREDLVEKADKAVSKKPRVRWKLWGAFAAAVLALVLVIDGLFEPATAPLSMNAYAISEASYPQMASYPEMEAYTNTAGDFDDKAYLKDWNVWWEDRLAQLEQADGYTNGLEPFFTETIRQFLSDTEGTNKVYAPLNVYMALGMLSELTDSGSREQILKVLNEEDIHSLRARAHALWNASYCDDNVSASILANSLWLNEDISFVSSTMKTLSGTYYASSYQGEMGSPDFNQALRDWLNAQTGGLLEEQAAQPGLNPDTILALASTIYFQDQWRDPFSENQTASGVFHTGDGDMTCSFMHSSSLAGYYWGEHFSSVSMPLQNNGTLYILLPDEGSTPEDLLEDEQAMKFLLSNGDWDNEKISIVNLSVPKFDVVSDLDLISGLKALGITDIFDSELSDFSPMTRERDDIYLSQARHAARVMIDEEGCTAVVYTVMAADAGGALLGDEIDFVADRPFLFVITGRHGLPLFTGIVNQPVS